MGLTVGPPPTITVCSSRRRSSRGRPGMFARFQFCSICCLMSCACATCSTAPCSVAYSADSPAGTANASPLSERKHGPRRQVCQRCCPALHSTQSHWCIPAEQTPTSSAASAPGTLCRSPACHSARGTCAPASPALRSVLHRQQQQGGPLSCAAHLQVLAGHPLAAVVYGGGLGREVEAAQPGCSAACPSAGPWCSDEPASSSAHLKGFRRPFWMSATGMLALLASMVPVVALLSLHACKGKHAFRRQASQSLARRQQ